MTADEPLGQRAESSSERVAEWADSLQRHGRPGLAELLRLLTAERDAALARATAAEARAGRLREALQNIEASEPWSGRMAQVAIARSALASDTGAPA